MNECDLLIGEPEIRKCINEIEKLNMTQIELIPLHSSLSSDAQYKVFKQPKLGFRKIVVATNIAETSVTIDDIIYVIDSGKMKGEISYLKIQNFNIIMNFSL